MRGPCFSARGKEGRAFRARTQWRLQGRQEQQMAREKEGRELAGASQPGGAEEKEAEGGRRERGGGLLLVTGIGPSLGPLPSQSWAHPNGGGRDSRFAARWGRRRRGPCSKRKKSMTMIFDT